METPKIRVSSWNEWDPLKHIIVGRPEGTMVQAPEPAVQRNWPEHGFPLGTFGPYPEDMTAMAVEQEDNFAKILESKGIRVDRPQLMDFSQAVSTPDWKQETMFGVMPPRDLLLTVGNEIVEATMSFRSRWFEYLAYRPVLNRLFKEDPNFRYEAAPKPRLTEDTYKPKFFETWKSLPETEKERMIQESDWILTEFEPCFDAADIVRFGKDLFVQKSMVTNDAGIRWLRQHFPNHRVHTVRYKETMPWHMDSTLIPLRPGLVMVNPVRTPLDPRQVDIFKMNDWEVIEAPKTVLKQKRPMTFCSLWLNMNILVLDHKNVFVEASEEPVMELLGKHGFNCIPVPFYEVSPFGGGLHCSTADVYREGILEDYLPKQIPGF
jgi:glycine amidinotransferase